MKIGIDANETNQENKVGVGQFAFNVISELEKLDKTNSYFLYLKEKPRSDLPKERGGWKYVVFGPSKFWTQIALPLKLFTQKINLDIFYSPSHYLPRFSPVPTVVSIMDLWHHRHPEQFARKDLYQLTRWEKYSVKKASHIIAISEFTKSEIIKFYQYQEEKITVAYPGFDDFQLKEKERKIREIRGKYGVRGEYLLYLGTLQPKKNIEGLIKAFSLLISNIQYPISNISLVIAGKKGWMFEKIFELVKELGLEQKVIFTGFIEEEEKPYLIAGAKAFVFPSLYEGFGIPVLEAMSLEVPVVCSREGSLPEVGGEAVVYCNPYEIESIAEATQKVLNLNTEARNEIIKKELAQVKKFSWEKCSRQILTVLEENGKKSKK